MSYNNSSNSSIILDLDGCPNNWFFFFLSHAYFYYVLYSLGIVLNSFCAIVFVRILYQNSNEGYMFVYLLAKSASDLAYFLINIFEIAYFSGNKAVANSYVMCVWYVWFWYFTWAAVTELSGIFEIAATVDCYITINKLLFFCKRRFWPCIVIGLSIICCFALNIYYAWVFQIVPFQDEAYFGNTGYYYKVVKTEFGKSKVYAALVSARTILRDGVIFVILIVLNVLIFNTLRTVTTRRRQIQGSSHTSNTLVSKSERAQRRKLLMIACMGVIYVIGHGLTIINWLPIHDSNSETPFWACFHVVESFLFTISYISPICVYFAFNKTFRRYCQFRSEQTQVNTSGGSGSNATTKTKTRINPASAPQASAHAH